VILALASTSTVPTNPVAVTPVTSTETLIADCPSEENGAPAKGKSQNTVYTTVQVEPLGTVTVTPEFTVTGPALIAFEPLGIE
jgi:hypothetical protein